MEMAEDNKKNGNGTRKGGLIAAFMPNKANVIGTVLLLVANFAGGAISRLALGLLRGQAADGAQMSGRFAGGGQFAGAAGAGGAGFGQTGLLGGAVTAAILAVLFYAAISLVIGALAEKSPA